MIVELRGPLRAMTTTMTTALTYQVLTVCQISVHSTPAGLSRGETRLPWGQIRPVPSLLVHGRVGYLDASTLPRFGVGKCF